MHFTDEGSELFLELFKKHRVAMASVEGCHSLEMFSVADKPFSYATISKWESATHLENYRQSELFNTIWKKIKPTFASKAEAFTLVKTD
jgi:hypothetical protein